MSKKKKMYPKAKPGSTLHWIGFWATVWWAVSCLYFLFLVLIAKEYFQDTTIEASKGFWSDWNAAINFAFNNSGWLPNLLTVILIVWAITGYFWLSELKKRKISYKFAFKDLFLTIRH